MGNILVVLKKNVVGCGNTDRSLGGTFWARSSATNARYFLLLREATL